MAYNHESVLWKRSEESSGNEEVWDDTALVEAYDRAVSQVKEEIAKRNKATVTNQPNKKKGSKGKSSNQKQKSSKWRIGDFCQSVFSEDGKFYEAYIQSIDVENGTVIVHYVGYENEEEVSLDSLRPSHGKRARQAQEMAAWQHQNGELDFQSEAMHSESSEDVINKKGLPKHTSHFTSEHTRYHQPQRPPSPAFPSSFSNLLNHTPMECHHLPSHCGVNVTPPKLPPFPPPMPLPLDEGVANDEEALASMLMSWYMSGYHTGYYQALRTLGSRQHSRKPVCNNCCHGNR